MQPPNTKALMNTESQKMLIPVLENKLPPLEDAPICAGTPWPKAGKMSGNLFKTRKDWLIPPNYNNDNNINTAIVTRSKSPIKIEPKPEEQPTTSLMAEKCGRWPNCPICKNIEEDWDGDHQKQLQQQPQSQVQMPQMQCPQALNYQKPQRSNSKTSGVSNCYPSQLKLHKQWEEEIDRLNAKYNLDCFSDSDPWFRIRWRKRIQIQT